MRAAKENNDYIYLTILATFIVLSAGTFVHDPILHSAVALYNGWEIGDYNAGLMVGQTTALTSAFQAAHTSTFNFWLFFMFPAIFIFVATLFAIIIKPDRLIIVAGRVLLALNFASLNPSIAGSDAYNAVQFLITRGWSEPDAYAVQYFLMLVMIILWGLYEYIGTENNEKDARKRAANIVG